MQTFSSQDRYPNSLLWQAASEFATADQQAAITPIETEQAGVDSTTVGNHRRDSVFSDSSSTSYEGTRAGKDETSIQQAHMASTTVGSRSPCKIIDLTKDSILDHSDLFLINQESRQCTDRQVQWNTNNKISVFESGQATEKPYELNLAMQRDIFNRIKHARGLCLRGKELTRFTDPVESAFQKHAVTLFPKEPRPFINTKKPKKIRQPGSKKLDEAELLNQTQVEVKLPLRGKTKLEQMNSTLLYSEPEKYLSLSIYARPESFAKDLVEKELPFPSNDVNKPTLLERIEECKKKIALLKSTRDVKDLPPELQPKIQRPRKFKPHPKIWTRQPNAAEQAEIDAIN